jgi:hypothetical protein
MLTRMALPDSDQVLGCKRTFNAKTPSKKKTGAAPVLSFLKLIEDPTVFSSGSGIRPVSWSLPEY